MLYLANDLWVGMSDDSPTLPGSLTPRLHPRYPEITECERDIANSWARVEGLGLGIIGLLGYLHTST